MVFTQLISEDDIPPRVHVSDEMAAKLSAGAALVYSTYYHPGAAELLKHFNSNASEAYGYACKAYGLGGR